MTALKFLLEFWQFTCRTSHIYSCFQLLWSYNHNVSMFSYSLIYLMFSSFGKWNMNSWWLWMLSFTSLSIISDECNVKVVHFGSMEMMRGWWLLQETRKATWRVYWDGDHAWTRSCSWKSSRGWLFCTS